MDLHQLRAHLDTLLNSLVPEDQQLVAARLEGLVSVFPFNEYEYLLIFLVDRDVISFQEYEKLRENYVSTNRYLDLFGLAPRVFGQVWGEKHIMDLDPRVLKADKSLDSEYEGQYDLWLDGVRIEVKAARAINTKKRGDVVAKALRYESTEPFWMNFQQLKLDICDLFVFIGVWVDQIVYWVLSNDDVKGSNFLSHQHRGGVEYQIGITQRNLTEFEQFRVEAADVAEKAIEKGS
jgi:hypothetical protein